MHGKHNDLHSACSIFTFHHPPGVFFPPTENFIFSVAFGYHIYISTYIEN